MYFRNTSLRTLYRISALMVMPKLKFVRGGLQEFYIGGVRDVRP